MDRRSLPERNRSAPCAISSGRVPGNPLLCSVRPCQPEPSSAAIPRTPPFSKSTIRMGFLLRWSAETRLSAVDSLRPERRFRVDEFHHLKRASARDGTAHADRHLACDCRRLNNCVFSDSRTRPDPTALLKRFWYSPRDPKKTLFAISLASDAMRPDLRQQRE